MPVSKAPALAAGDLPRPIPRLAPKLKAPPPAPSFPAPKVVVGTTPGTDIAPAPTKSSGSLAVVGVVVALLFVGLAAGGYYFWRHRNIPPSAQQVQAAVQKVVANPALVVGDVVPTVTARESGQEEIDYRATAELREPLYEQTDTATVLKNEFNLDPEAWDKARASISGADGPHILELAGLKGVDDSLLTTVYLKEVTARGAKVTFSGHLKATKTDGDWHLVSSGPAPTIAMPAGQARAQFHGRTAIAGEAAEMGRLRELAKAQADVPAKVEQGRLALVEERRAGMEKTVAGLAAELSPGTLFGGTATGSGASERLWLEVTDVQADDKRISAELRNSGGWMDKRPFHGTYAANPEDGTLTVTLVTQRNQAVKKGGPFLDRAESWQVVFSFSGGKLTGHSGEWDYQFTRLSAADITNAKAELDSEADAIRTAIGIGKVFRGSAKPKAGGDGLEIEMRFTRLENDGAVVGLILTSPSHPSWQRNFRGGIIGNTFRDDGWPIHLETATRDYVKAASGHPILSAHEAFEVNLKLVDGRLVGASRDFNWDLGPVAGETVAKQDSDLAAVRKQIFALVKSGASFTGRAHAEGSDDAERIRIRFTMVDQRSGIVEALLESLETSGLNREFKGTAELQDGKLVLASNGQVRGRPGRAVHLPAFVDGTADASLSITLDGEQLAAEVLPSGWVLDLH
jgi:hypothetical protein